uniref:Uncharacterized protein n=1 Tax=Tanacetum cinerariifolium TaxID=118510 RepID=A0A6L2N001_TANCI|nr:hypothetical protein [Tanacetum cinerariifolium]
MTDYSLWEVILNGDSPIPTRVIDGVVQPVASTTAEQRLARKIKLNAQGTLLMALPDNHQLKFNIHKDAKSLMEAIEKRFGGNKETKKPVSVVTSVSAASTKVIVYAIPNVDTLSDDVIYSFIASQSNSPQLDNDVLKQIVADDLEEMDLKWQMAMLIMRARRDNALVDLRKKFEKTKLERDELKLKLEKFQTSLKNLSQVLASQITNKTGLGYNNQMFNSIVFDCDELISSDSDVSMPTSLVYDRFKSEEGYRDVPPPYTGTFMPPKRNLVFHDAHTVNETVPTVLNVEPSPTKPKKDLPVTTVVPYTKVPHQKPTKHGVTKAHSPSRRTINLIPSPTHSNFHQKVTTVKATQGNPHHALKDKGVIDNGCSRHMTGNISYLSDFKKINKGYVAFGRNPKGGKITGKGKTRTMCDKKNNVLFTYTECIVLSSDFKFLDDNHVLLRVPRENNMYNVDLKNIVTSGDLTCLFAKATLDESNLWHRRLGHINFKTMNKMVKGNLVRGLPSKGFENNHTCVACKKGKKHRAFCIQEHFDADKAGEGNVQQYMLFPLWSTGSKDPRNTNDDATFEVKEPESEVHVSPSSSAKTKKHDDKTTKEAQGKSPVELSTRVRNLSEEFEDFSSNSTNKVNAASKPVTVVEPNLTNSTNTFSAAGPSNNAVSLNFKLGGKSSYVDPSQYPDDPDIPALEDITYSDDEEDVGAEADFSNLETNINVLVDLPKGKRAIGLKWVFRNKKDKRGIVIKNKARLVTQGHTQEEGIYYEEVFAPVARIEAIRLFLAYASFMGFMDLKTLIILICQPPGFKDSDYPDKVYKVVKALYGLHQASRAWYATLANYLLENVKQKKDGIFISQDKYVAKILRKFGLTDGKSASTPIDTEKPLLKDSNIEDVDVHTYRSVIGSLMYLTSSRPYIMFAVCACDRFQVTPKASHLQAVKRIFRYLKGKPHLGLWYPKDSPFNLVAYSDSDYVRASLDRKSTTGGCQFLGCRLISWQCKKQTVVATLSTEAEYVAAASCCAQVLWIQNQLLDYGYNFMYTTIYIDNNNDKKLIQVVKIPSDNNFADLLTKAFDVGRF